MKKIMKHLWGERTWIQRLILVAIIAVMMIIWPLCLVREEYTNRAGDYNHLMTEPLQPGMTYTQKFYAERSRLSSIGYVLFFNPEAPLEGGFLVEVVDWEGNVLFTTEYPYNLTPDYRYCDIPVNLRLRKGDEYELRLTNLTVTQNVPCVMYTEDPDMYASNHCGMTFDGQSVEGESLVRYIWSVPLAWDKILVYWGFVGVMGFMVWELEEVRKLSKKRTGSKNE